MNENGIEGLCKYIVKDPQGKKRYSSSRNLDRPETTREDGGEKQQRDQNHWKYSRNLTAPEEKCNDFKYSKRKSGTAGKVTGRRAGRVQKDI